MDLTKVQKIKEFKFQTHHVDLSSAAARKFIIKHTDIGEDVQKEAVDMSIAAFEKHNVEKDVAEYIKELDKKHGPTWHCIVGKNFGRSKFQLASSIFCGNTTFKA
ncbi:uncharacterized protein LOC130778305 isoform X3 [Actinidia eriantha]|uniref:uncharacterized protein LOC130778305 isoform X3 n=1 Tax=Actinidia eriantha TaxID=165200 RepID=UPI002583B38B|nr:uncharacterized protein LOC130778305 isoform X3 [Actinidia eriantha]